MEKVFIGNEANEEITSLLESVVLENKDNERIIALYLREYCLDNKKTIVELEMIVDDFDFPIKEIQNRYKDKIKTIYKKYGIQIMINYVPKVLLEFFPDLDFKNMDFMEIVLHHSKCLDFMNSRLILDKTGKYQTLQEKMLATYIKDEPSNVIEFVPPLELKRLKQER